MTAEDDAAAVERVLAGDVDAYESIVLRWQGPLVNLAFRFCRDRHLAEDMAQDAFLQAFRRLDRWRGESRFSTWLHAVALNVYRTRMRRHLPPMDDLAGAAHLGSADDPESALDARASEALVRDSVVRLPARYRDAVVLFYFQEESVEACARMLGVSPNTFKSWLHRGRALLRRQLAPAVDETGRPHGSPRTNPA